MEEGIAKSPLLDLQTFTPVESLSSLQHGEKLGITDIQIRSFPKPPEFIIHLKKMKQKKTKKRKREEDDESSIGSPIIFFEDVLQIIVKFSNQLKEITDISLISYRSQRRIRTVYNIQTQNDNLQISIYLSEIEIKEPSYFQLQFQENVYELPFPIIQITDAKLITQMNALKKIFFEIDSRNCNYQSVNLEKLAERICYFLENFQKFTRQKDKQKILHRFPDSDEMKLFLSEFYDQTCTESKYDEIWKKFLSVTRVDGSQPLTGYAILLEKYAELWNEGLIVGFLSSKKAEEILNQSDFQCHNNLLLVRFGSLLEVPVFSVLLDRNPIRCMFDQKKFTKLLPYLIVCFNNVLKKTDNQLNIIQSEDYFCMNANNPPNNSKYISENQLMERMKSIISNSNEINFEDIDLSDLFSNFEETNQNKTEQNLPNNFQEYSLSDLPQLREWVNQDIITMEEYKNLKKKILDRILGRNEI